MSIEISEILAADSILVGMTCQSKKDALDTLAKAIASLDSATSQTEVFDCLLARERLGSTGLGKGIAIPHGRLEAGKKTLAVFIQLQEAIDYDAVDKKPVDLLFALIVPEESTDEHLQILARLAEMFSDETRIEKLRASDSATEILSLLSG